MSPTITVASPNGGENLVRGTATSITWQYSPGAGTTVKLELLKGTVVQSVLSSSRPIGTGGSGTMPWTPATTLTPDRDYRIRVTSLATPAITDTSDSPIGIT